jgi:hypothetical protein
LKIGGFGRLRYGISKQGHRLSLTLSEFFFERLNIQMTSVLRFLKQRPSDTQYFLSLLTNPSLQVFYGDAAASTNTYVSGAAAGFFSTSTASILSDVSNANITTIFRDMGVTIVSSMRTFRRVQLITLDGGNTSTNTAWSSQGSSTAGVWQGTTSTYGVTGSQVVGSTADSSFGVFYYETGASGLGIAQGLVRYG